MKFWIKLEPPSGFWTWDSWTGNPGLNHQAKENMYKAKEELKEIYKYQIDPDYVNDSLMGIRNKLTEFESWSKRNIIWIGRIAVEPGETREECE